MAEIFSLRPNEHDAVQKLLPWFVNDTLPAHESERVANHLAQCEECREDLSHERKLARAVASLPLNADDGWKAMQLRMDAAEPPGGTAPPVRLATRRVPLAWAVAGSLAASVALTVVMTSLRPNEAPQQTYHTLGSAASAAQGQAVVLFKPDTTAQQMSGILSAQRARVVDGPTAAGAYVLRVDGGDIAGAVQGLSRSPQVVLAQPLANDGRP